MSDATKLLYPLALLLCLAAPSVAAGDEPGKLTFEILADREAFGAIPSDFRWSPDGKILTYVWGDSAGEALWMLEVEKGKSTSLLRLEGDEDGDIELNDYLWSPDGKSLLLVFGGDLHLLSISSSKLKRLTETEDEEKDPKFSPDGKSLAFVLDYDLHLLDLATGRVRALTEGGEKNKILNGITDWVYWEELWGRDSTGFWWSADGSHIAYYQFDEEPVATYTLLNSLPRYPEVELQKYPKAGTTNPRVRVGVLDLAGGETTWLDTGDPTAYLARVHWMPPAGEGAPAALGRQPGRRVAVQRLNREQNRLDLLACDAASGICSTFLTEEWPTWVNLGDEATFLVDGRLIWASERSGWRHLYLYGADGRLQRPLTSGEGFVSSLDAVEPATGKIFYTASDPGLMGATDRQIYRLEVDGEGAPEKISSRAGWHSATVAPATGHWVDAWSTADDPGETVLRRADGKRLAGLPSRPAMSVDPADLPRWKFLTLAGPGGSRLPARLLEPLGREEGRKHPVIMYHYGCPASQVVVNRWDRRGRDLWHKMMAQRGYVILMVDNQASSFFGKRGEDHAHRRFGPGNLAAQEAAVDYLKTLAYADTERIGLWGWSGGGSNTLYALLNSPGTWKAGVSGAPVTDWRLYDTIWTERYLDHPDDNPAGYEASSPTTYAEKLEDGLLIIHGTGDDNVHPQNTLVFTHKLIEAGKAFEQGIYPRQKHGFRGPASLHFSKRMTEFFERKLAAPAESKEPEVASPEALGR